MTAPRDAHLFALRAAGKTLHELAAIDGRSVSTVFRRLAGIPSPSRPTEEQRFWCKVNKTDTCWLWTAATDSFGYGLFRLQGSGPFVRAHRWSYEHAKGPIPNGLQMDHLCRLKNCVNPAHLEAVTPRENTMRAPLSAATINANKTTCAAGHALGGSNRFPGDGSGRSCRTCQEARQSAPASCPRCGKQMRTDSVGKHLARVHREVDER